VVFVQLLRIVDASVKSGQEVLRDTHKRLNDDQDVGDQAEDGVGRLEVSAVVRDLVVLDDDEAGDRGEKGDVVERGVGVGAFALLLGGVGGLEDEDAFDEEEDGGGVEELGSIVRSETAAAEQMKRYVRDGQRRASGHG